MSFQHIANMARRHGMPAIIMDEKGSEPVVVLPLSVYETLIHGRESRVAGSEKREQTPTVIPVIRTSLDHISKPTKGEAEPDISSELSMEERFYTDASEETKI